jgi:hypothetical protein
VMERYGKDEAAKVEWSAPRLICIAGDFTRYDEHAVNQISRNITFNPSAHDLAQRVRRVQRVRDIEGYSIDPGLPL